MASGVFDDRGLVVACPACGQLGLSEGVGDSRQSESTDQDKRVWAVYPYAFTCGICGLEAEAGEFGTTTLGYRWDNLDIELDDLEDESQDNPSDE